MARKLVLPILLIAVSTSPAAAQGGFSGPLSPGAFESTLGIDPIGNTLREQADAGEQQAGSTRFVRDPALMEAKEAQIVAAMRQQSPEAAAELEQLFAQDVLGLLRPEFDRMGLNPDDVADMTAVYWIVAWEASHGIVGQQTERPIAQGARNQLAGVLQSNASLAQMSDADKQDMADAMLLQAILIEARMDAAARAGETVKQQMSDMVYAEAAQLLGTDLRAVTLTEAGFAPAAGGAAPAPGAASAAGQGVAAAATPGAPASHAGNWAQVEDVYFRSTTGFGVGGMVTIDYEPLIFFKDGTYFEIHEEALEDIDLGASRGAEATRWGRWARTAGGGFTLTDSDGDSSDEELQDGSFFQAFPADAAGNSLGAKYTRVSGGGNSALGGEMTIAAQTDLTFAPDGRYMNASSAGAIGSGSMTGVATAVSSRRAPNVGSYSIERHTITMTEPGGETRRQFFAFGSRGNPPQPASDMIFIGDRVFVVMD